MPPLEFGSCKVDENWYGFRFQRVFQRLCMAATIMFHNAVSPLIYAGAKPDNKQSIKNIIGAGFTPLQSPSIPQELYEACVGCKAKPLPTSERCCCCDFYISSIAGICREVSCLLSDPTPGWTKNNKTVYVDHSEVMDRTWRRVLDNFIKRNCQD